MKALACLPRGIPLATFFCVSALFSSFPLPEPKLHSLFMSKSVANSLLLINSFFFLFQNYNLHRKSCSLILHFRNRFLSGRNQKISIKPQNNWNSSFKNKNLNIQKKIEMKRNKQACHKNLKALDGRDLTGEQKAGEIYGCHNNQPGWWRSSITTHILRWIAEAENRTSPPLNENRSHRIVWDPNDNAINKKYKWMWGLICSWLYKKILIILWKMLEIFSRFLALSLSFSCSHADADSEICPKNTVYIRGKSDSQESNHVEFEVGHIQTLFSIDENALALLCIIHLVLSYFFSPMPPNPLDYDTRRRNTCPFSCKK